MRKGRCNAVCNTVSNTVQNVRRRCVQNQNQNQTVVKAASGVSGTTCIASHGDLDAASCNATETIEHLDFEPPCENIKGASSRFHHGTIPPAAWQYRTSCCGTLRMRCDECVGFFLSNANTRITCTLCGARNLDAVGHMIGLERL